MPARVELRKVRERDGGVKGARDRTKPGGLKVGLVAGLGEHPESDDGTTIVEVGAVNEFGAPGIPERPFIRGSIAQHHGEYERIRKQLLADIIAGKKTVAQAVAILGIKAQADMQKFIVDLKEPPNSPETQARKAEKAKKKHVEAIDNPLIDSGIMRKSINWEAV